MFGKFALEIRMDYWYLWKTHFLNFRDFQESPNPLKFTKGVEWLQELLDKLEQHADLESRGFVGWLLLL